VKITRALQGSILRIYSFASTFQSSKMPTIDSNTINKRGAFILFEGCDRTGKSTQANKLFEYLQSNGHSVKLWKFPGILINPIKD
jgi:hypothetical protein